MFSVLLLGDFPFVCRCRGFEVTEFRERYQERCDLEDALAGASHLRSPWHRWPGVGLCHSDALDPNVKELYKACISLNPTFWDVHGSWGLVNKLEVAVKLLPKPYTRTSPILQQQLRNPNQSPNPKPSLRDLAGHRRPPGSLSSPLGRCRLRGTRTFWV